MKTEQFKLIIEQISTELSVLLTASDVFQQEEVTNVIAEVFADYDLDIAEAWEETYYTSAERTEEDYQNDRADELRSERIADQLEDEYKEEHNG